MHLAVVTGHTRGLGKALTAYLRGQGLRVAGCSRSAEPPDRVDVADANQVQVWADQVGTPDLLVCNAGLTNHPTELWNTPVKEFSRLVDVNVKGTYHTLRAFLPGMVRAGKGVIVVVSSDWGRTTSAHMAPYCCSKFALEGLTRALAQDLPAGMAAVALDPGTIDTDMLRTVFADGARYYPTPEAWIKVAGPYLLSLGPQHNGQSLSIPDLGPAQQ